MDRDYEAFISYRHKECNPLAKALHDEFWNSYAVNSFRDDEGLHFGDFRVQLIKNNKRSQFLVLLLTPETLDRCNQPDDWITKEVSLYLERKKPIIPVKLNGFEFPETLPEAIEGLREHECRAITCNYTDTGAAARFIALKALEIMREGWKPKAIGECMVKRKYLCDTDTAEGYFAHSANKLRDSGIYLIPMLAMAIGYFFMCFKVENNTLVYDDYLSFFSMVFALLMCILRFLEHKKVQDPDTFETIPFSVCWTDRSELKALAGVWGWIMGLSIVFTVLMLFLSFASIIVSSVMAQLMFPQKSCGMETDVMLAVCAYASLVLVPCGRLIIKSALELCHFINSLFTRYPQRYLNWKRINLVQTIWKFAGWPVAIIAAACIGGCLLVLRVV